METGYFGGIHRGAHRPDDTTSASQLAVEGWHTWQHGDLFARVSGQSCAVFSWHSLALVIRGFVRLRPYGRGCEWDRGAEEIRSHYLENGNLPVSALEGSFTLALLDAPAGRIQLYRNLVGAGFTY